MSQMLQLWSDHWMLVETNATSKASERMMKTPHLPARVRARLLDALRRATDRAPDEIIGDPAFLDRWDLVPRNNWRSFYLHKIFGSDNETILHDHPWPSISFILSGAYVEHTIRAGGIHVRQVRSEGDIILRRASTAHRLEVDESTNGPCWTLFLAGPRVREWGFHAPGGWIHWTDFAKHRAPPHPSVSAPIEVTVPTLIETAADPLARRLPLCQSHQTFQAVPDAR